MLQNAMRKVKTRFLLAIPPFLKGGQGGFLRTLVTKSPSIPLSKGGLFHFMLFRQKMLSK